MLRETRLFLVKVYGHQGRISPARSAEDYAGSPAWCSCLYPLTGKTMMRSPSSIILKFVMAFAHITAQPLLQLVEGCIVLSLYLIDCLVFIATFRDSRGKSFQRAG